MKNTNFDKEEHLSNLKELFKIKSDLPLEFKNMALDRRPEGAWELGYMVAAHYYKTPISEFSFNGTDLNLSIVDFLKQNATCIFRLSSESDADQTHVYMYKNVFLNLQLGTREDEKKLLITSLVAYYNVETGFPYEDFSSFYVESKNTSPKIGIIKSGRGGMYISKLTLNYKQEFSFDHYNEDFPEFENYITTQLSEKTPGLYLLHGDPGTGKSSAIRHLVKSVNRNFIFIPPQMISHLSSPEFADIITDTHKGSVLILEDAEKALMKRESEDGFSNSTLVSSILNLTDGLYADLAQLAIIATYNCDRNLIDPALLRKGRLKAEYRFNKLNVKKAKVLAEKLDKNIDVTEDMSLADIFNYEDQFTNNKQPEKRFVGFGR
jgi:hypothetical protein